MRKKQPSKSINKQLFADVLMPELSKSVLRKKQIIEGAIQAYSLISYKQLSYDDIAKPAGTSRKLVQHYFPDKRDLFEVSMTVIRAHYQALVIKAFIEIENPREKFIAYIRASVSWPEELPSHVRAWFLYYLVCSSDVKMRKLHEEFARIGSERIMALVQAIKPASAEDLTFYAKTVQRLITGGLIEHCSEQAKPNLKRIQDGVVRAAVALMDTL